MYNYEKNAFFGPFKGLKNTITKAVQNRKAIKGAENMLERHSKYIGENFNNIEAVKKRTNVLKSVNSQRSNIQNQMGDTWLAKGIKKRQDARLNKRMEALNPENPFETILKNPRRRSLPQSAAPAMQEANGSFKRPMLAGGILGAGGYHLYDKYTNDPNRMYKQANLSSLVKATKELAPNLKKLVNKKVVGHWDGVNVFTGQRIGGPMHRYSFNNDSKALKAVGKGLILPGAMAVPLAGVAAMPRLETN